MFKRFVLLFSILVMLLPLTAYAQDPPDYVVKAVELLGQYLGKPDLELRNMASWYWEEAVYNSAAIGCPAAGQSYAQTQTRGYKVLLTYGGTEYDIRFPTANPDDMFLCINGQRQYVTVQPTPTTPPTTATPATASETFYFVNKTGNVAYIELQNQTIVESGTITTDSTIPDPNNIYSVGSRTYHNVTLSRTHVAFLEGPSTLYAKGLGQSGLNKANVPGLVHMLPLGWTGSEILYATSVDGTLDQSNESLQLMKASPDLATASAVTNVPFPYNAANCPPTMPSTPAQAQFNRADGSPNPSVLRLVGGTLYYTPGCDGLGLYAFDVATGALATLHEDVRGVAISPDNKRAAGIIGQPGQLVLIDLTNGTVTGLSTGSWDVRAVTWSMDASKLYFSTAQTASTIAPTADAQTVIQQNKIQTPANKGGVIKTITIQQYDLSNGATNQVFADTGLAFVALESFDGGLLFIKVGSDGQMIQALNANPSLQTALNNRPKSEIILLRFGPVSAQVVAEGYMPTRVFTVSTGTTGAPTSGSSYPYVDLVVGQQAKVVAEINLRDQPATTSTRIGILYAGDVVDVIGGPTNAGGYRWWQVRTAENVTGWAADYAANEVSFQPLAAPVTGESTQGSTGGGTATTAPMLTVGGKAKLLSDINFRSSATTQSAKVGILYPGQVVDVIGGPISADGYRWWNLRTEDGLEGWAADLIDGVVIFEPVG